MTITKRFLRDWEKSARIYISPEQKRFILERFGTEPEPDEWSEQDIAVQVRNFLGCGEFVKSIRSDGNPSTIPPGVEF